MEIFLTIFCVISGIVLLALYIVALIETEYGDTVLYKTSWYENLDNNVAKFIRFMTFIWLPFFCLYKATYIIRVFFSGLWIILKAIFCRDVTLLFKDK